MDERSPMRWNLEYRLLVIAAVAVFSSVVWAQKNFPSGWHPATLEQLNLRIKADLDGDGKLDVAQVLTDVNKRAVAVMAYTSSNQRWAKLDSDSVKQAPKWHVRAVEPGSYPLTCAADDKHCAAGPVDLKHAGVAIVVEGQPDQLFYWDAAGRKFQHGLLAK